MRWGDLTRSVLYPLGVPALLCSLWFAGWAGAFAAQAEQGSLPPLRAQDMDHLRAANEAQPDETSDATAWAPGSTASADAR